MPLKYISKDQQKQYDENWGKLSFCTIVSKSSNIGEIHVLLQMQFKS